MKRAFRIATLFMPSCLAWYVAFSTTNRGDLTDAVLFVLGPLWALLAGAIVLFVLGRLARRRRPIFAQTDILTASGSALSWTSALAIMGAVWIGWASLAVVGLVGAGIFHVVVLYTFIVLRRSGPTISRRFVPEILTEGEDVVEEVRIAGNPIPVGFRLFLTGRIGPRWATSRYVVEGAETTGETVLESNVGPAVRGDYDAPPLEAWLEDVFGICRSMREPVAVALLRVLPRASAIEKAPLLAGRGIGPRAPREAPRLPTEGSFDLREYHESDDVRRIHWVRSLAAGELIVRLPDEVPPDRPRVRVVLDTFFPWALSLECDAPSELLDASVRVWLAVGRALAESGAQVTLVSALRDAERGFAPVRHLLLSRAHEAALRLGAQIAWQNQVKLDELLTDEPTLIVARAVVTHGPSDKIRWILVAPLLSSPAPPLSVGARLHFPMGAPDNRASAWRRVNDARARARRVRAVADTMMGTNVAPPPPGSLAAFDHPSGAIRLEALR
jgi:uncharacterized protein (DUF58 family)